MFVVIFNLLFMNYSQNYSTLFSSLVTIFNAGVGNFSYNDFDNIPDIRLAVFGKLFLVILIVVFLILMLNLIIAILTNVSNTYENLSTGLFLSKILSTREQLESDEYYGAFISAATPFNIFIIPFIPFALSMQKSDKLITFNKIVNIFQYMLLLSIFFTVFVLVSILLIPFAYIKSIVFKIKQIFQLKYNNRQIIIQKSLSLFLFIFFGILVMSITLLADCFYFWKNNFRTNLKKIVVEKKRSEISIVSFKRIIYYC